VLIVLFAAFGGYPRDAQVDPPTFNRDVAPILYRKCVTCHRPGEAAPMSLITYDDVRPWARAVKLRVANREMPPWFADPRFSRPLANQARLTDGEIATIVDWVDAGARNGAGSPPPLPPFVEGWRTVNGRPPDAILEMSSAVDIPADGAIPVFTVWSPNPFPEDKFVEAVELRPGSIATVHHSDVTARTVPAGAVLGRGRAWPEGPLIDFVPVYPDGSSYNEMAKVDPGAPTDDNRLVFYVPGGGFQQFPAGSAKRISAGNALAWQLHYTPSGKPEKDRHQLGLWFARTPPAHEVISKRIGEAHIVEGREFVAGDSGNDFPLIPPYAADWRITAIMPVQDDVTVYGLWPHMHLRGKDMTFIATYPDGREEVLLHVPKYDFRWQLQYELVDPVHLPAGSTIKAIGHYDNSLDNKRNPNPAQAVKWSEQTRDEMFNGWLELSVDREVIDGNAVYTIARPVNDRIALGVGSGPPGRVLVRNRDGSIAASASIGEAPSFIEPWTFAAGQTIQTERTGDASGTVTLTVFDVPPDVKSAVAIDGPAVVVTAKQPGQNGSLTFTGSASQRVTVHVFGNRVGLLSVALRRADTGAVLTSSTASSGSFNLPALTLPGTGAYIIEIDPIGTRVGSVNVALTSTGIR